MRKEEFEKMKENWLRENFMQAVTIKPEEGGVIAAVPLLYKAEYYRPRDRSELTRFHTGRDRFILRPIEAHGTDTEDGISALFEEIVMYGFDGINQYLPKRGQNPAEVIKVDEPMECVHQDDPEHDHSSPRLVDFLIHQPFAFGPREIIFQRGSLDGPHSHFLIG